MNILEVDRKIGNCESHSNFFNFAVHFVPAKLLAPPRPPPLRKILATTLIDISFEKVLFFTCLTQVVKDTILYLYF